MIDKNQITTTRLSDPRLESNIMTAGYVCAPYLHNHNSVELKDSWSHSRNIEDMFFVTATFSSDSKPYFPSSANHYLLAKFKDRTKIEKEIVKFQRQELVEWIYTVMRNQSLPSHTMIILLF